MATIEEAVTNRMLATNAITTLIGSGSAARLYPLVVPQTAALPAIAYQKISSPKEQAHTGSSHLARSRIQFTCEAGDYATVKRLAIAVKQCWDSFAGIVSLSTTDSLNIQGCAVDNDVDSASEQGAAVSPVVRLDVLIWHYEA
jgi:hypothetical protein